MKFSEFRAKIMSRYLWGNLIGMVLVVAAVVAATMKGIAIYSRHGQEVAVPRLKGMSAAAAERALKRAGLECVVSDSGYVKRLAPGTVLDQSIEAGAKVKPGREVELTVNASSPPTIVMPDLADNSSLREAQSRLQALGFNLTPPEYVDGEKEWVYGVKSDGKSVVAGTRVSINSRLTLVVGNGMTSDDMEEEDSLANEWYGGYGEEIDYDDAVGHDGDRAVE